MLESTEILKILHFHLMQQAQMTTFQEKCGLDCFVGTRASVCSDCRSAAGSCASIGSLCSQMKLVRAYCLWQTFCIFQPVLAFVKSKKCGRKTTCLSLWWRKTDGIHIRAVLFFHRQYSKIVKIIVNLQSGVHEAIFI